MWQLIIIILCLGINAFLAGAELAFVSMSRAHLRKLANQGEKKAEVLLKFRENPERTLSVIQLGITFVGVIAAAVGGAAFDEWLAPLMMDTWGLSETISEILAILLFVVPYTFLSVVLSELLPKSVAFHNPKWMLLGASRALSFLDTVLSPIVNLLEKSTKLAHRLVFSWIRQEEKEEAILVGRGVHPYAMNLAKVESKTVRMAMVHWEETDTLEKGMSVKEVEKVIFATNHTRLPVVESGEPIGILYAKDFLASLEREHWSDQLLEVFRVQEEDPLIPTFKRMQSSRCHMAIAYRGNHVVGMMTLEDIIEEIFGEIYDESDLIK